MLPLHALALICCYAMLLMLSTQYNSTGPRPSAHVMPSMNAIRPRPGQYWMQIHGYYQPRPVQTCRQQCRSNYKVNAATLITHQAECPSIPWWGSQQCICQSWTTLGTYNESHCVQHAGCGNERRWGVREVVQLDNPLATQGDESMWMQDRVRCCHSWVVAIVDSILCYLFLIILLSQMNVRSGLCMLVSILECFVSLSLFLYHLSSLSKSN